jgi:ribosomal protein S21
MVEVRKRDKETSESLIRRFTRQLQQSGVLMRARKTRFRAKRATKRELRERALYNQRIRAEIEKLKKMGKFDEEKFKDYKKKVLSKEL